MKRLIVNGEYNVNTYNIKTPGLLLQPHPYVLKALSGTKLRAPQLRPRLDGKKGFVVAWGRDLADRLHSLCQTRNYRIHKGLCVSLLEIIIRFRRSEGNGRPDR